MSCFECTQLRYPYNRAIIVQYNINMEIDGIESWGLFTTVIDPEFGAFTKGR